MKKIGILSLLFVLLFGIQGCVVTMSQLTPEERRQIEERVFEAGFEEVFKIIRVILMDAGYGISSIDEKSGFIITDWRAPSDIDREVVDKYMFGIMGRRGKLNIYVEKLDEKKTKVRIQCFVQFLTEGVWRDWDLPVKEVEKINSSFFEAIRRRIEGVKDEKKEGEGEEY